MRTKGERDAYLDVGEATRRAIDVAMGASLAGGDLKVLLVVVHLLTSRSRTWDYTSHKQLADLALVTRRSVIRSVKRLCDMGAIAWSPGGPGQMSKLSLPVVTKPRHQAHKPRSERVLVVDGVPSIHRDGVWVPVDGDETTSLHGDKKSVA